MDRQKHAHRIYPEELVLKAITTGCLKESRYTFDFHNANVSFLDSNIPTPPVYGMYVSQLVRYYGICVLLSQWYMCNDLRRTFKSF
jgi:hypothetical protein